MGYVAEELAIRVEYLYSGAFKFRHVEIALGIKCDAGRNLELTCCVSGGAPSGKELARCSELLHPPIAPIHHPDVALAVNLKPTFPRSAAWVRRNPVRVLPI